MGAGQLSCPGNVAPCPAKGLQNQRRPYRRSGVEHITSLPSHALGDGFDEEVVDVSLDDECPAGATFEETVQGLSALQQDFLHFCSTPNIVAVRWLLLQGGCWQTRDSNGTHGLHAACRAGSPAVVEELLQHSELTCWDDVAGWTPLHVAAFLGRHNVVVLLLRAGGAPVFVRDRFGRTARELCGDAKTQAAIHSYELHISQQPDAPWNGEQVASDNTEDTQDLQYTPFFVPMEPITKMESKPGQRIAMRIFNHEPGYGLAFLRAAGAVQDYPYAVAKFMRKKKVDPFLLGQFLGQSLSLSRAILLEFVHQSKLAGTGVISALLIALKPLRLPSDLHSVDRIVYVIACEWWRQHRVHHSRGEAAEVGGQALSSYLSGPESLQQLMMATVFLHDFVYGDGSRPRQYMGFKEWANLLHERGNPPPVPESIQLQIWTTISKHFFPELCIGLAQRCSSKAERHDSAKKKATGKENIEQAYIENSANSLQPCPQKISAVSPWLSDVRAFECWAQVDGLSAFEVQDQLWISVASGLLFFSFVPKSPTPCAFISLKGISAFEVRTGQLMLDKRVEGKEEPNHLVVAVLQHDGRWNELSVRTMLFDIPSSEQCKGLLASIRCEPELSDTDAHGLFNAWGI
eukprot:TRINITY_DN2066_c0_g1_i2.p1 TRINITY_DN2066_c0_g1~~TRINITY_DN2066_c0_g1_i2.p1  ORF type:complete len:644 (-),score=115.31 TRINITY_DN2066_c0_g1_i2:523-2418(-)